MAFHATDVTPFVCALARWHARHYCLHVVCVYLLVIHVDENLCVYACVCVCMCVCMCVCVCVRGVYLHQNFIGRSL